MKKYIKPILAFLPVLTLVFSHANMVMVGKSQESQQPKPAVLTVKIVDGFFHHLDMEKKLMYVVVDKQGEILQSVSLGQIDSVYLIQGKPEKLRGLLAGGSIGAVVGFSSLFWKDLTGSDKSTKPENQNDDKLNIADLAIRIGGGAGVGLIVGYFKDRGEESVRPFPVYDLKIKQTNPNPSINFSDIGNLAKMLREGESFVHVTLKDREEK